jgi:hypothetical protein
MKRSLLFLALILSAVLTGCVAPTFDPPGGSYPEDILVGYIDSLGANYTDVWLIKTDADGNAPATPTQ